MRKNEDRPFCIIGAGLAGTLFSIFLAERGIASNLFDKRLDMRKSEVAGGRSIVMSLSERGWTALREVGVEEEVKKLSIPKYSRFVHHINGSGSIQNYGCGDQAVYSINRKMLNSVLLNKAESTGLVDIHFNYRLEEMDIEKNEITFLDILNQKKVIKKYNHTISADGIFSKVRDEIAKITNQFSGLSKNDYVYKEMIVPSQNNDWALPQNYIHVWPRKNCFFVAMPNFNRTFTCTLFYHATGLPEVNMQNDEEELLDFLNKNFPEVVPLIPNITKEFLDKKVSDMYCVKSDTWFYKDKVLIMGDAAHAIVPFYGMGMNVAFEDCRILNALIDELDYNWEKIFSEFYKRRKPEVDGIADLSLKNLKYLEHSMDDDFEIKWKLERKIWKLFPDKWMPDYSMVAFSHIPFTKIIEISNKQNQIMNKLLEMRNVRKNFMCEDFQEDLSLLTEPMLSELNGLSKYFKVSKNKLVV
ncbi:MAG: hypothetical protein A2V93_11110 [Ignavibacteria bacterium RBG_16_34_14]|nr:MAG: hypothetical protein A2V93_11110 [Ignavibacteria bacterium RBG_16_34_14]